MHRGIVVQRRTASWRLRLTSPLLIARVRDRRSRREKGRRFAPHLTTTTTTTTLLSIHVRVSSSNLSSHTHTHPHSTCSIVYYSVVLLNQPMQTQLLPKALKKLITLLLA